MAYGRDRDEIKKNKERKEIEKKTFMIVRWRDDKRKITNVKGRRLKGH